MIDVQHKHREAGVVLNIYHSTVMFFIPSIPEELLLTLHAHLAKLFGGPAIELNAP